VVWPPKLTALTGPPGCCHPTGTAPCRSHADVRNCGLMVAVKVTSSPEATELLEVVTEVCGRAIPVSDCLPARQSAVLPVKLPSRCRWR